MGKSRTIEIRAFERTVDGSYKTRNFSDDELKRYADKLETGISELKDFKKKYSGFAEFEEIFDEIDRL